jgi:integrase/recombinase XerD
MANKAKLIKSAAYILLLQSFKEWLQLLNYSVFSIAPLTGSVAHFLLYQEENDKLVVEQLVATDANDFIAMLQTKIGERTKKPLSNNHLNKQIQALKLFSRYLRETGRSNTGFTIERMEGIRGNPGWLTKPEIKALYEATAGNLLGIRDKAMLAVFYGCGLRLNEGAGIEIKDIDWTRKVLHVRKGKHYKERFVPVAEKNLAAIKLYVDYARPQLLQQIKTDCLFVSALKGKAITKQSLYIRIKVLVKKAAIKKKVGTHTLRHSIATHLLQSGMKLERIQQFLGHGTIDSTQIYTHLVNEAP